MRTQSGDACVDSWLPSFRITRERGLPAALAASKIGAVLGLVVVLLGSAGFISFGGVDILSDFSVRLVENRLFVRGIDPLQIIATCNQVCPDGVLQADNGQMPWSYPIGLLLVPPVHSVVSAAWFLAANLVAIAGLVNWQRHRRPATSGLKSWTTGLWIVAMVPVALTLYWGNYALIVTAMIAMSLQRLQAGGAMSSGLLLGLATIKPHLALPFFLVLLVGRHWKALVVAITVPLTSTVLFLAVTGVNPLTSALALSDRAGVTFGPNTHFGFLDPLRHLLGWSTSATTTLSACAGLVLLLVVLLRLRVNPPQYLLAGFGAAAATAALWSYHRRYDFVILIVLLAAAQHLGARHVLSRWQSAAFAASFFPVWLPTRELDWFRFGSTLYIGTCIAWLLAMYAVTVVATKTEPESEQMPGHHPGVRVG